MSVTPELDVAAVGFVPSTPLLIPDLAGAAPGEPDEVRAAARQAVDAMLASGPDRIVVMAASPPPTLNGAVPVWDFTGFGLPAPELLGSWPLPWQLGLGAWLLDDRGWDGRRDYVTAFSTAADLVGGRTAYLAVGDGSVHFADEPSDGFEGARETFDRGVAAAIAAGDVASLSALARDPVEEIRADAPPVWRQVAAAVGSRPVTTARLVYDAAPYGVRYFAGWWLL
ncbi:MAG TPA: hypothetical protein VHW92_07885 [Mycobacteriales bacterium]|nr:hypothetical protein [Mycobacteriales bacterium]